ncbi:tetraacyldisaccharide 4'-kinase [Niabella drilacis]|uniref:Tetraacyldisaccharide 4'-kinase n=1 Tax=Niabella drilacis (strain DSM 25811 / CCM 8410 / CCUG 62505 / LMG 26954 / E90) TaxID=1285928 RepID=A0A1G6YES6_NIADE|nr:tetraacyldisaccharide 4'-kinase [Niabella drilacis]SDD88066.1 lipid-A-disaccharide kinase [Niabella drilacis]
MSFKNVIKKKNRLLLPISWLYVAGVRIFSFLYDSGIKKSRAYPLPVICVGNLSVGGTGKSPMVEYLVRLLRDQYRLATVSRGYGRKTKGFLLAGNGATAAMIGDEPLQFHTNFPDITVVVSEKRAVAIETLLRTVNPGVIILDDAFQHRAVTAGFNIVLTAYDNRFPTDDYLPAGQLRDLRSHYKRADCIVVTKCPADLTIREQQEITREIRPLPEQQLFFASLQYGTPYPVFDGQEWAPDRINTLLLVTGIANPEPLRKELDRYGKEIREFYFEDHYDFKEQDIARLLAAYAAFKAGTAAIITTEKDRARLVRFREQLQRIALFALPVQHCFLLDESEKFDTLIRKFIQNFEKPHTLIWQKK